MQAEKEAALIPDGMRIMGDDERTETLSVLETNKEEVESALSKLPFVVKTPSQVRLKNQLERRLHEIEEAVRYPSAKYLLQAIYRRACWSAERKSCVVSCAKRCYGVMCWW